MKDYLSRVFEVFKDLLTVLSGDTKRITKVDAYALIGKRMHEIVEDNYSIDEYFSCDPNYGFLRLIYWELHHEELATAKSNKEYNEILLGLIEDYSSKTVLEIYNKKKNNGR